MCDPPYGVSLWRCFLLRLLLQLSPHSTNHSITLAWCTQLSSPAANPAETSALFSLRFETLLHACFRHCHHCSSSGDPNSAFFVQVRAGGRKSVPKDREIRSREDYIPSTDPYSAAGAHLGGWVDWWGCCNVKLVPALPALP